MSRHATSPYGSKLGTTVTEDNYSSLDSALYKHANGSNSEERYVVSYDSSLNNVIMVTNKVKYLIRKNKTKALIEDLNKEIIFSYPEDGNED